MALRPSLEIFGYFNSHGLPLIVKLSGAMAISQDADPDRRATNRAELGMSLVVDNVDTCVSPGLKKDCWFIPILASVPRPALGPILEGSRYVPRGARYFGCDFGFR